MGNVQGVDGVDVSTMKKEWTRKKETKKAKQEDAPIVIWESESTTDEEYPTGRRKRVNDRKKINGTSVIYEDSSSLHNEEPCWPPRTDIGSHDASSLSVGGLMKDRYGQASSSSSDSEKKESKKVKDAVVHNSEYLIHTVTGKETLQGLALRYGVQIAAIKRMNRLWTNDDIFGKHELIIPISSDEYLEFQSRQPQVLKHRDKILAKDLDTTKKNLLISKFTEITRCDRDLALHYLEEKSWNFTKSLGFYYSQQENGTAEEMERFREQARKKLKEEIIEEDNAPSRQEALIRERHLMEGDGDVLWRTHTQTILLAGGKESNSIGVTTVKKRIQERHEQEEEEIFEI